MNIIKGKVAKAQKVVLYGPEGIGKSSLAAQFPNPLFIDTEGSTGNMDVARLEKPSSLSFMEQQIDFVIKNRPCKTLVIDTIDWAEQIVIAAVLADGNKKSITGFGYGEGFIQLSERMGKLLNKLSDVIEAGINVVLTAHSQIVRFEQPDEMGAYDRYELKLGNKTTARTAALVKEWADMVLFLNYKTFSVATDEKGTRHKGQGGIRTMYATHHPAWDAKNRHALPDEMAMDYGQIAHIFNEQALDNVQQTWTSEMPAEPPVQQEQPQTTMEQQPVQNTNVEVETPQAPVQDELNPALPQSLRDLMKANNVTEVEIQAVVGQKGYFPMDTPIVNYPVEFIEGVLVSAWDQVYPLIVDFRKSIPFN